MISFQEKAPTPRCREAYLLPNRSLAAELLARCLLRFGLVDFDHAAIELGLVHVVDGFEGVFGEGEFDVAEASVRVLRGFSGECLLVLSFADMYSNIQYLLFSIRLFFPLLGLLTASTLR